MVGLKTTIIGMAVAASFIACGSQAKDSMVAHGTSMLPAIRDGQRLTVKRFDPEAKIEVTRGDVVAFWFPNDPSKTYFARLVGMPGETVEIREGAVFISGRKLDEPYVDATLNRASDTQPPLYVKPHYYYVLGDNRDNSSDSRMWGLVPEKYIYAKVVSPDGRQP
jgi:signal peptidase I